MSMLFDSRLFCESEEDIWRVDSAYFHNSIGLLFSISSHYHTIVRLKLYTILFYYSRLFRESEEDDALMFDELIRPTFTVFNSSSSSAQQKHRQSEFHTTARGPNNYSSSFSSNVPSPAPNGQVPSPAPEDQVIIFFCHWDKSKQTSCNLPLVAVYHLFDQGVPNYSAVYQLKRHLRVFYIAQIVSSFVVLYLNNTFLNIKMR